MGGIISVRHGDDQRWKIGHYSNKNFEDLGKFYSYIHI